jgi:hypothetical protein
MAISHISLFLSLCIFFVLPPIAFAKKDFDTSLNIENTHLAIYGEATKYTGFNRIRLEGNVESIEKPELTGKIIIDNETIFNEETSSLRNTIDFYRGFISYIGEEHSFYFGRQRIPFGVGRIWTPVDIFNPLDSTTIEPDEREGTDSLRYEYSLNELSQIDITLSRDKGAFRVKGFLEYGDVALIALYDNETDTNIIGWELEGEFLETGIEVRSEGGIFFNKRENTHNTEIIIGAEYGFPGSLTFLAEYYYDELLNTDRIGMTISYQATPLLMFSLLNIFNLTDGSTFTTPGFNYSLSDEMTLSGGILLYNGSTGDEFGLDSDLVFLNWFIHF